MRTSQRRRQPICVAVLKSDSHGDQFSHAYATLVHQEPRQYGTHLLRHCSNCEGQIQAVPLLRTSGHIVGGTAAAAAAAVGAQLREESFPLEHDYERKQLKTVQCQTNNCELGVRQLPDKLGKPKSIPENSKVSIMQNTAVTIFSTVDIVVY